jgi:uncharacterized HAD superfamily protein
MSILIFRTNIIDAKHVKMVSPHIKQIEGVSKWNIDLQDEDKVLRVVANDIDATYVELVVQRAGYQCSEME